MAVREKRCAVLAANRAKWDAQSPEEKAARKKKTLAALARGRGDLQARADRLALKRVARMKEREAVREAAQRAFSGVADPVVHDTTEPKHEIKEIVVTIKSEGSNVS